MGELLAQYDVFGAFWMTIRLTLIAGLAALVLGTLIAVLRLSPVPLARWLGTTYVTLVRNTPLTLIVVFCQLGLYVNLGVKASDNVKTNAFWLGLIGLSTYTAAFVCEALRSGVNTVPVGQAEAARSIGLSFTQTLRHVVLPQAFRAAIAPLGSVFIALTKNTTVLSVIGVAEISYLMSDMVEQRSDLINAVFGIVAIGFVILTLPMGLAFTALSRRWRVAR